MEQNVLSKNKNGLFNDKISDHDLGKNLYLYIPILLNLLCLIDVGYCCKN